MSYTQVGGDIGGITGGNSGYSVAINGTGDRVVVGSPAWALTSGLMDDGLVNVYELVGSNWGLMGSGATFFETVLLSRCGNSVGMNDDGTVVVVGAPLFSTGGLIQTGRTRIYNYLTMSSTWNELTTGIEGTASNQNLGHSVAIDSAGNSVVIGSPDFNLLGSPSTSVDVYDYNGTTWVQRGSSALTGGPNDLTGAAVAMAASGNRIMSSKTGVSGVPPNTNTKIVGWDGANWNTLISYPDTTGDVSLGIALAISKDGSVAATASPLSTASGNPRGRVEVFQFFGSLSLGSFSGTQDNESFGYSVALNQDGTVLAVGAPLYNGTAGVDCGRVLLYYWEGSSWNQFLIIEGEQAGEQFGFSVALSNAGTRIIVGSPYSDSGDGLARIFEYSLPSPDPPTPEPVICYPNCPDIHTPLSINNHHVIRQFSTRQRNSMRLRTGLKLR